MSLVEKIFGSFSDRELKKVNPIVKQVLALEPKYAALSDAELQAQTPAFKQQLADGKTLDDILPDAFAVCREAAWRVLGMKHFPVQITGGIALHRGDIAEMQTGEGKTLVATLPAYLNALTGKGVHVVTVNDYLAKRDSEWMGKLYRWLGLSVGLIVQGMDGDARRAAYGADITYGTNNEFGFDYLRDNMVTYQTPKFSGFQATVQYSLNESSVDNTLRENSSQVDRYLGLALTAELGALQGVLAYETQNYASFGDKAQANTEDGQVVYLGGNYDFEVAKVFVMGQYFKGLAENPFASDAFERDPVDGEGVKGFGAHVGTIVPVAGGDFTGGLYYVDSTVKNADEDADGKYYGIALKYEYPLSKRTSVYGGTGWYKAKLDYSNGEDKEEGYQAYLGLTHCF